MENCNYSSSSLENCNYSSSSLSSDQDDCKSEANGRTRIRTTSHCTPPPSKRRVSRSPFVTPGNPLYVFGDSALQLECGGSEDSAASTYTMASTPAVTRRVERLPPRPQKGKPYSRYTRHHNRMLFSDVLESISPFGKLETALAFDAEDTK